MMEYLISSDDLKEIKEQTKAIYEKTGKFTLVTGMLRYFKTTTILDWNIKSEEKLIYVTRTNRTTDESVAKVETFVKDHPHRQLVTLRGKGRICPRVRKALKKGDEVDYEVVKVKHCMNCPLKPGKRNRIHRETLDEIEQEKIIDVQQLHDYYSRGICPAEVIIHAAKTFNTVFMTYAWLEFVKEISSGQLDTIFHDATLICDEARHLENYGISSKCIGHKQGEKRELTEAFKCIRNLDVLKDTLDYYRRKQDCRDDVDNLRHIVKIYINFLNFGSVGAIGTLPFDGKEVYDTIQFLQRLLVGEHRDQKVGKAIEFFLILTLWIHKNLSSTFFFDFNKIMYEQEREGIYLTGRRDKEELTTIFHEASRVFLVDSTPPPTRWSKIWLGGDYDIDVVTINPATSPDIRVLLDRVDRRWTRTYHDKDRLATSMRLVTETLKESNRHDWVVSTRSKKEKEILLDALGFHEDSSPFKIIYLNGEESEGVQLYGNHILTGLQYIHPEAYASQKEFLAKQLGYTDERGYNLFWKEYIWEKTMQSFIQQLFRTYSYKSGTNLIAWGLAKDTYEKLVKRYQYLKLIPYQGSQYRESKFKIIEALSLIEFDRFPDKIDMVAYQILKGVTDRKSLRKIFTWCTKWHTKQAEERLSLRDGV